jgi:hypothetical protein
MALPPREVVDRPWLLAEAIDRRERGAVEAAVAYLEEDPWIFRSGYGKALLLRRLKRVESALSEHQRDRLRRVLVHYVDVGPRWDLREACSLARTLDDAWLRDALVQRLHGEDEQLALRAARMLLARRRLRLNGQDLGRARDVMLVAASRRPLLPRYAEHMVRRLWSAEWGRELLALVDTDRPPLRAGAKGLLRAVPKAATRLREPSP